MPYKGTLVVGWLAEGSMLQKNIPWGSLFQGRLLGSTHTRTPAKELPAPQLCPLTTENWLS